MVNAIIRLFSRSLLLNAIMAEMTEMSTRVSLTRKLEFKLYLILRGTLMVKFNSILD